MVVVNPKQTNPEMVEVPIKILPLEGKLKSKDILNSPDQLGFGQTFSDRMFIMEYADGAWKEPTIKKNEPIPLDPASLVFHYAQEIFEGMKGFRQDNGRIVLFRPQKNIKRMNRSADRMCMPNINPEVFLNGLKKLISLEKDWVPHGEGTSMYIRPTMIATQPILGVRPSNRYLFFIILSPSGPYFKEGFKPIKIFVSDKYVRAVQGGTGFIKAGGNYGSSLKALEDASKHDSPQVLWLDAVHHKYIEEVGAMNFAVVMDGTVYTAPLDKGTILPGVTRESVIQLCKDLNIPLKEESLAINDVTKAISDGRVTETFGIGTAAVIAPVGSLIYKKQEYIINDFKVGPITQKLYDTVVGIQRGRIPDSHNWIVPVED
ncbi:MAG: branched-chain amino acid aminotransferase [Candidatus Thorarchaeota archaeon]